jgi:hypothetical protein
VTALRTLLLSSMFVLCALVAGCASKASSGASSGPEGTPSDPVKVCTKEGQTCVFTEGKLGLCTQQMERGGGAPSENAESGASGDAGAPRFTCMSLH